MDRRDKPETAVRQPDSQLRAALDVIALLSRGVSADRLYDRAIACFDGIIEVSRDAEAVRDIARLGGLDPARLVESAHSLISKMHFNPENNHYITLGLPADAPMDAIRHRWKSLMLLYHPDLQGDQSGPLSELAKKVNEAYNALKDNGRRADYDQHIREEVERQKMAAHAMAVRSAVRKTQTLSRGMPGRRRSPRFSALERYLPKVLTGLYLLAAVIFLGVIYLHNRPSPIETELAAGVTNKTAPADRGHRQLRSPVPERTPADALLPSPQVPESEPLRHTGEKPSPYHQPPATVSEPARRGSPETRKPPLSDPDHRPAPSSTPARDSSPHHADTESARETTAGVHPPEEAGKPSIYPRIATIEAGVRAFPGDTREPAGLSSQSQPPVSPDPMPSRLHGTVPRQMDRKPDALPVQDGKIAGRTEERPLLTRQDVAELMERYVRSYEKNDLAGLLSLFSKSAVENDRLRYNEIRRAYAETFRERINRYKIHDMVIRIEGDSAMVTGNYEVERYSSADDRSTTFRGRILWKIVREENGLKIIRLNYDR